ncbi:hypothetical protein GRJ2_000353300 [Grus japonensis]|uniref:Uncharacterized protein n=1 Tax=Grus japonensis TaxID=30415 RepID=A0ABC9W046_GRUJA
MTARPWLRLPSPVLAALGFPTCPSPTERRGPPAAAGGRAQRRGGATAPGAVTSRRAPARVGPPEPVRVRGRRLPRGGARRAGAAETFLIKNWMHMPNFSCERWNKGSSTMEDFKGEKPM